MPFNALTLMHIYVAGMKGAVLWIVGSPDAVIARRRVLTAAAAQAKPRAPMLVSLNPADADAQVERRAGPL